MNEVQPATYRAQGASPIWKLAQTFCRIMTTCLFDLKVYGVEHVPAEGGALIVSNHQSYLDPVLLGVRLRRPISYLAKSELFENPLFGGLITWLNAFPVRQGAGDVGAVKETISRLQSGRLLNIFPEGSRSEDGELRPLEKGFALVVRRARVPVIPAIIDGSYDAWPKGSKLFHASSIHLMYGPPMELADTRPEQIVRIVDRTFHEMLAELRRRR